MVRKKHKVICLVLCLMLAVGAVFVGTVGAAASSGDTVYVRLNNGWSTVYCYMWKNSGGSGNENQGWPGVQMTSVGDGVYSYTMSDNYTKVIFDNNAGAQTADLDYPGANKIYDLSTNQWSDYSGPTNPVQPTTTPVQPTTTPVPGTGTTVYLNNTAGWSNPNCYMWNGSGGSGNENNAWPGVAMTSLGDNVWMYSASTTYTNCIFNGGGAQTGNLTAQDGYIYDNSTKQWSIYDVSAIRVTSYSAEPSADIYTGTAVQLSAEATSGVGTVSYKFSVTNANGGTSVISNFGSANSVTWTPTTIGTYTVTFDFQDTEGNVNSRTLSLTVADPSSVAKPIIQNVTPGNLNLVQTGHQVTVNVTAAGGNTGTNLLFYKYIVTDPNGGKNTPYYTLNNTYNFTPTMDGQYKVEVYVQSSDNTTISRTYTYTATGNPIVTTTAVVSPTTAKPTQGTTANDDYILGDVTRDGKLTIRDATYLQKFLAEYPDCQDVTLEIGDVTRDGRITIKDATQIQRIISQ